MVASTHVAAVASLVVASLAAASLAAASLVAASLVAASLDVAVSAVGPHQTHEQILPAATQYLLVVENVKNTEFCLTFGSTALAI